MPEAQALSATAIAVLCPAAPALTAATSTLGQSKRSAGDENKRKYLHGFCKTFLKLC